MNEPGRTVGEPEHDPGGRGDVGPDRDRTAEKRDRRSEDRDRASEKRDESAEARDRRAEEREQAAEWFDPEAASDRVLAKRDRQGSETDRAQAGDDRRAASADRARSTQERAASFIDGLTGVHRRESGIAELEREMARAKREQRALVVAYLDVDGLKTTNDSLGHAAGDRVLREVGASLRAHLRSYDLIVRWGGDEFLCALVGLSVADAVARFSLVHRRLDATQGASITVGFAEMEADDSLQALVARADASLYREREPRV
jgi:diguanylate cyclase (GGDEF)-like protein